MKTSLDRPEPENCTRCGGFDRERYLGLPRRQWRGDQYDNCGMCAGLEVYMIESAIFRLNEVDTDTLVAVLHERGIGCL